MSLGTRDHYLKTKSFARIGVFACVCAQASADVEISVPATISVHIAIHLQALGVPSRWKHSDGVRPTGAPIGATFVCLIFARIQDIQTAVMRVVRFSYID